MKSQLSHLTAACALALGLFAPAAQAIKIVVPEQYQDQIEAIKKAERQEREQELQGVADTPAGGIQIAGEEGAAPAKKSQPDADEFLVQSVVEAEATAATFEGTLAADEGLVAGQIVDKETGEPIAGAAILVEGADIATVTAEDGRYSLGPVPAGSYTLSFIKTGYIEANVTDYTIAGGEVSVFPFALPPRPAEMSDDVYELQDFTVTAEQANQLMMELDLQKISLTQLDIMGSEDFSRFAASDIADAVKSITGVSLSDGKYAVVRGLNDRYSVTQLNGVTLPSPDPDRAAVPLDVFPTGIFRSIETRKTNSPDMPGEASGGVIDLKFLSFPEERILKFSVGTGFNTQSQDDWLATERQGGRDYFASGSKERDFTQADPLLGEPVATGDFGAASEALRDQFYGDFNPIEKNAKPDFSASFLYGETFDLSPKSSYSLLLAANQSWKSRFQSQDVSVVRATDASDAQSVLGTGFMVNEFGTVRDIGSFEAQVSTVAGLSYAYDERLEASYRFIFTRSGIEESVINTAGKSWQSGGQGSTQTFQSLNGDADALTARGTDYRSSKYTERTLYGHQFEGSADMTDELGFIFSAALLETRNEQDEPDSFDTRAGTSEAVRYRRVTNQDSRGFSADLTVPLHESFEFMDFGGGHNLKFGISDESSQRDFIQEQQTPGARNITTRNPTRRTPNRFWNPATVSAQADGAREIFGRYAMIDSRPVEWMQIVAGFRVEDSKLSYDGFGATPQAPFYDPELIDPRPIDQTDVIPSINLNFDVTEKVKLRFAYSETIARPTYRELQPFPVLNLLTNEIEVGNPGLMVQVVPGDRNNPVLADTLGNPLEDFIGLRIAEVRNLDARVEWYPTDDSMFALGFFWKKVGSPIERVEAFNQDTEGLPVFTFINNENDADLFGVELEMRQNIGALFNRPSLEFLSVGGNFTYIEATVQRSTPELAKGVVDGFRAEGYSSERSLFDQPDILANFFINLNFEEIGADITLSANHTGDRLTSAAGSNSSDIFEDAVTTVNLVYSQRVPWVDGLSIKLAAKNITDPTFSRSTKENENSIPIYDEAGVRISERALESYTRGIDFSISANYEF